MVPGGRGSQISRQSVYESGKVVSPTPRLSLLKNDSEGIESATSWLVAQCLNQLHHRAPSNAEEK